MNILDTLKSLSGKNPDSVAMFSSDASRLSYRDLLEHLSSGVSSLSEFGLSYTDRVVILLPQGAALAVACLSVMSVCTAVPLNPDLREGEYRESFERLRPAALLVMEKSDHPACVAAIAMGLVLIELERSTSLGYGRFKLPPRGDGQRLSVAQPPGPEAVAILLQTSGTTSRPKTVPLTHRNLLESAENVIRSLGLLDSDRCLHFLPMFHVGGIVDVLLAPLLSGGSVVCMPAFSIDGFARHLDEFAPTWTQSVPIVIEEVLSHASLYGSRLDGIRRLRLWRSVSAPLRTDRQREFEEIFGVPVIEIYGMSETAGLIASNPLPPLMRKPGSVGISAGPSIAVVDSSGELVPTSTVGELLVRGANVMAGYLETSGDEFAALVPGGWLRTGDLGYLDDEGYLFLTGRAKDIINRGGEKISPGEIDEIIRTHPAVDDAAAFPIFHPSLGEEVGALVVLKLGYRGILTQEIVEFAKSRMAFFKLPKIIKIVDKIPREANGKLRRATLAALIDSSDISTNQATSPGKKVTTPVARKIASLWTDILGVTVDRDDDAFFDVGGNSLKATSFTNRLQDEFGELFYVSSVFDAPTVHQYESFIFEHYPSVAARILGDAVVQPRETSTRVNREMVRSFIGMVNRPSPKMLPETKNPPAVFILSAPRSGSTLLRAMLAGHPRLFSPPELYLLSFDTLADRRAFFQGGQRGQLEGNIRALMQLLDASASEATALVDSLEARQCPTHEYYGMLQRMIRGRLLVDKTPDYGMDPVVLRHAEGCFEAPYYIHLVRHPYGMIRSFEEARLEQLWGPRLFQREVQQPTGLPFNRRQFAEMVWLVINRNIIEFLSSIPQARHIRINFEDLVSGPRPAIQKICDLTGLTFEEAMLTPHDNQTARMTDGIHEVSRMIGDPKFHRYSGIEGSVADQWKTAYTSDFLSEECLELASILGYQETILSQSNRVEFSI